MPIIQNPLPGLAELLDTGNIDLKGEGLVNEITKYSSDGLDYIYDLEPPSQNLFYAGYFREADNPKSSSPQLRPFFNAAYRIQSVDFNLPKLSFKHHKFTHIPQLDTKTYDTVVTIGWLEDVYHSVQKYHQDWMGRWYNRPFDVLRCGPQGKFRRMALVAFHYVNASDSAATSVIEVPMVQPLFVIDIAGLVPEDFGDMKFDHKTDGNDEVLSIKYKASRMSWHYTTAVAATKAEMNDLWTQGSSAPKNGTKTWNPAGFFQDDAGTGRKDDEDLERLRVARNATSYWIGETSAT